VSAGAHDRGVKNLLAASRSAPCAGYSPAGLAEGLFQEWRYVIFACPRVVSRDQPMSKAEAS
jgi:hypothetical protein